MKRRRASDTAPSRPKSARADYDCRLPHELVVMIWDLMSQFQLIRARRVARLWKDCIDDMLRPALDAELARLREERMECAHAWWKKTGLASRAWLDEEYLRAAVFKLGYVHMMGEYFRTPSAGRASMRKLKASVHSTVFCALLSDTRYMWCAKDYDWALSVACRRGHFDAVPRLFKLACRMVSGRVDKCAAQNAVDAGCSSDIAGLLLKRCTDAARRILIARIEKLREDAK